MFKRLDEQKVLLKFARTSQVFTLAACREFDVGPVNWQRAAWAAWCCLLDSALSNISHETICIFQHVLYLSKSASNHEHYYAYLDTIPFSFSSHAVG